MKFYIVAYSQNGKVKVSIVEAENARKASGSHWPEARVAGPYDTKEQAEEANRD